MAYSSSTEANQHQNDYQRYRQATSGAYHGSWDKYSEGGYYGQNAKHQRYFGDDNKNKRDLGSLIYAKGYGVKRAQGRSKFLSEFTKQSEELDRDFNSVSEAQSLVDARYDSALLQMEGMRSSMKTGGTQASSIGQYTQLAKREIQNTQRMVGLMDAVSAPEDFDGKVSIINPFTGEDLDLNTNYEDIAPVFDSTSSLASTLVRDEFTKKRAALEVDFNEEHFGGFDMSDGSSWSNLRKKILADVGSEEKLASWIEDSRNRRSMASQTASQRYNYQSYERQAAYAMAITEDEFIQDTVYGYNYLNNRALADMAGYEENFYVTEPTKNQRNFYGSGAAVYAGTNIDEELDKMSEITADRMEIDRLADDGAYREEFDRRKEFAIGEKNLADNRSRLNQARAEQLVEQKRAMSLRLEQQKQAFAETLTGATSSDGQAETGINFTETRPL
tara:strand:- start:110 stop:1447 length:1338 start_codon:yes stop_codon:yes gene_type:complete